MARYRKKLVVIDAEQWVKNCAWWEVDSVLYGVKPIRPETLDPPITMETRCDHCQELMWDHGWVQVAFGGQIVCPGDWIIQGPKGEKYPCRAIIFDATYELVSSRRSKKVEYTKVVEKEDDEDGTKIVTITDLDAKVLPSLEAISNLLGSGLAKPTEDTKLGKDMQYLQRLNNFCNDRCLLNSSSEECKACPVMRERERHMPDFNKL